MDADEQEPAAPSPGSVSLGGSLSSDESDQDDSNEHRFSIRTGNGFPLLALHPSWLDVIKGISEGLPSA